MQIKISNWAFFGMMTSPLGRLCKPPVGKLIKDLLCLRVPGQLLCLPNQSNFRPGRPETKPKLIHKLKHTQVYRALKVLSLIFCMWFEHIVFCLICEQKKKSFHFVLTIPELRFWRILTGCGSMLKAQFIINCITEEAAKLLEQNREELAIAECIDTGKPIIEARIV